MAESVQIGAEPRSEAELKLIIQRFETKWRRRRRAHPIAGFAL